VTGPDRPQTVVDAAGAVFQVSVFSAQLDDEGWRTMPLLCLDRAVSDRLTWVGVLGRASWNRT
jgi:hypothetical protein